MSNNIFSSDSHDESSNSETSTHEALPSESTRLQLRRDTLRVFGIRSHLRAGPCAFNSGCTNKSATHH